MKKFTFVLLLALLPLSNAQAETPKSIVVIDSGVNTALFTNVVAEVCILEYSNCPNGKAFMEGAGASNTGVTTNPTLTHGTEMLSIINKVSPSVGLIPIRIVGITDKGNPYIYSNNAVKLALDWVVANRVKYNIAAVNVSQGKIFDGCKVPEGTAQAVALLKANNVAVVAASGNDGNRSAMHSIACLPDVVSVGATDNPDPTSQGRPYDPTAKPYIARYSNGNAQTSFYANARWITLQPSGKTKFMAGTSNSSAALTAWWVLNLQGTWADTYNKLSSSSGKASNEWLTGKYVQLP